MSLARPVTPASAVLTGRPTVHGGPTRRREGTATGLARAVVQLQEAAGNRHTVAVIQRDRRRQHGEPAGPTHRERIQASIDQMRGWTAHFQEAPADAAAVDHHLNDWLGKIVVGHRMIKQLLDGDAALYATLCASYRDAVRALLTSASRTDGRRLGEWYFENNGRIPPWAWERPHRRVEGFSAPIDAAAKFTRDGAEIDVQGVQILIRPDQVDEDWSYESGYGKAGAAMYTDAQFDNYARVPTLRLVLHIQWPYAERATQEAPMGRGTSEPDRDGAALGLPSNIIAFHEASHMLDLIEFLRSHPLPRYGKMPGDQFLRPEAKLMRWKAAWRELIAEHIHVRHNRVDCAGKNMAAQAKANILWSMAFNTEDRAELLERRAKVDQELCHDYHGR